MQQILDRTQESLAQAFTSLARNARRQQQLYYATVGLLVAIVIVSGLLLAGLAVARHLDIRRSHVAQYVSALSLQLQSEAYFLRRTALTIRYYLDASGNTGSDASLLTQIRRTGVAMSDDGRYALLVPESVRHDWGDSLPRRIWQLQQIATATLTTQTAFELNHPSYVVDPDAEYAIVLSPLQMQHGATALQPGLVAALRDGLVRHFQGASTQTPFDFGRPVWIGPIDDPIQHARSMISVLAAPTDDAGRTAWVVSSIPATAFLDHLERPSAPAKLWLLNNAGESIDVSPITSASGTGRILSHVRRMQAGTLELTRDGLLWAQPLRSGFGSLVYCLPYMTLLGSIATELAFITALGLLLILCIGLTARYWDIHLLRRSHAEAARSLENETINHILVSATPIGLCIVRQDDNFILTSNAVADALLGQGKRSRMPAHIMAALQRQDTTSATQQFASIAQVTVPSRPAATFGGIAEVATSGATPDTQQFLQVTLAPARYRDEAVFFCAIQDITAQHQLELQLRSAREAAESMMRARSNFFASMSHEIRTPLNALLGNLELLARSEGLEAHAPRMRALQVASDGLQRIVNDILDFSKIDAGEMKLVSEPFRPLDDLESLSMSYAPMVQDRPIRFYVHLSPTLDAVLKGDRTRIAQIINNLLSNAFKFTSCGKVTLSAEITTDTQDRSVLVCQVRDSGIGMPPPLVARIFHPFVQGEASTSARYGGTGLGLSICARLTELMHGHITVESVEGVGTAFTVAVPLKAVHTEVRPGEPVARGSRAMILCQETESGTVLQSWLERAGWRVDAFHNAGAAQAWLRANQPHVLVVTGEYDREVIMALQRLCPANAVRITRDGPEQPALRNSGIIEVSTFSHEAILAGMLTALNLGSGEDNAIVHASSDAVTDTATEAIPEATPGRSQLPGTPGIGSSTARRTILVAEDNVLNQTLIAEQLETLGWHPVVVGDGRQALSVLEHSDIDVVLTDSHMPGMDCYALLTAIRAFDTGIPVLAFSAVTHTGQADEWRARGFTGHIAKPASLRALEQALQPVSDTLPCSTAGEISADLDADAEPPIPSSELARYRRILRDHLQVDEPELEKIMQRRDCAALCHWAHRSAGAFLIVGEHDIVTLCRTLEDLCRDGDRGQWIPELAKAAGTLHAAVRNFAASEDLPG